MTKYLVLAVKIILSIGLIWYIFRRIDFSSAWTTLLSIPLGAVLAALVLLLVQFALSSHRLKELLRQLGQESRLTVLLDIAWIGAFFSQTLISFVGGDAMRVWRMVRFRIPLTIATQAVLLDRLAGFAGVVVVLLLTIPFLIPMLESLEMKVGLILIASAVLAFIFAVFLLRRLPKRLAKQRVLGAIVDFASRGVLIARSGRGALYVLGLSVLIQLGNVLILFILAQGLSINLGLGIFVLIMPTVLFLSMLPISIAGWGVREGAMVGALAVVGVPAHQSLALSICFGLCLMFVSLPGGIIWFTARNKTLPAKEASELPT
jgi:glycosyltransferase 2 family protein